MQCSPGSQSLHFTWQFVSPLGPSTQTRPAPSGCNRVHLYLDLNGNVTGTFAQALHQQCRHYLMNTLSV